MKPEIYLAKELEKINKDFKGDPESAHSHADEALLRFINSEEVTAAFNSIDKWYA
jgi:hypothetical protein